MTVTPLGTDPPAVRGRVLSAGALAVFAALFVAGETWAKWWPYAHKIVHVVGSHAYPGHSMLVGSGGAPSWSQAWDFTVSYGRSVWVALAAALVIGAGVQSLLPPEGVARLFGRTDARGAVHGALAALPSLMCTCCSAPVTNSLRRAGASRSAALAYWLGNPLLNPAVLVFLALVLPWQYAATRLVVGAAIVVGGPVLVGRLVPDRSPAARATTPPAEAGWRPVTATGSSYRFARALVRLAVVLVPEYLAVVLLVGAFKGWLLPFGQSAAGWGTAAVLVAAAAGTVLVIPTGAEIPVIVGLIAVGFGPSVSGAVLIALPAISLPSMIMVGRDLSWRVVAVTATTVMAGALLGAALVAALVQVPS